MQVIITGVILIEEDRDKKCYCEHTIGQFKESKKHYHSAFS